MTICIIFHSASGITRGIAGKVNAECGGTLTEVTLPEGHSLPVTYFLGLYRSMKHEYDPINPDIIDVSGFDCVVIGTPVWARKPTPAIISAVEALTGCEGKKAVLFATCRSNAGDTLGILTRAVEAKGMIVRGQFVMRTRDIQDGMPVNALISRVKESGGAV